jgi:hypothetical protein
VRVKLPWPVEVVVVAGDEDPARVTARVAPGMTAPVGSTTEPAMLPVGSGLGADWVADCACSDAWSARAKAAETRQRCQGWWSPDMQAHFSSSHDLEKPILRVIKGLRKQ